MQVEWKRIIFKFAFELFSAQPHNFELEIVYFLWVRDYFHHSTGNNKHTLKQMNKINSKYLFAENTKIIHQVYYECLKICMHI